MRVGSSFRWFLPSASDNERSRCWRPLRHSYLITICAALNEKVINTVFNSPAALCSGSSSPFSPVSVERIQEILEERLMNCYYFRDFYPLSGFLSGVLFAWWLLFSSYHGSICFVSDKERITEVLFGFSGRVSYTDIRNRSTCYMPLNSYFYFSHRRKQESIMTCNLLEIIIEHSALNEFTIWISCKLIK